MVGLGTTIMAAEKGAITITTEIAIMTMIITGPQGVAIVAPAEAETTGAEALDRDKGTTQTIGQMFTSHHSLIGALERAFSTTKTSSLIEALLTFSLIQYLYNPLFKFHK
jgi:hypothetical protein